MNGRPLITTEKLIEVILPWAKERHPDKYADTLKVASTPATFRRYLARLIEIRWNEEPEWRTTDIPLDALEETSIVMTMRFRPTGTALQVMGRRAKGPRMWSFAELAMLMEMPKDEADAMMDVLVRAKAELDLALVE